MNEKVPDTPHEVEIEEALRATFRNPPERVVYRPLGISVQVEEGLTVINMLISPGKFVQVELVPEGKAALLQQLAGGVVLARPGEIPGV